MSENRSDQEGRKFGRELPGHVYDGISELDNPTPRWWTIVFIATIIFGIGYLLYYHAFGGPSQAQELQAELSVWEEVQKKQVVEADATELEALTKNAEELSRGKEVFTVRCASCHGDVGQGLIGPNLTDDAWLYGTGAVTEIFATVRDGKVEKGMPAWGQVVSLPELKEVSAYVRTLRGTNPPNPKAPQGAVTSSQGAGAHE